MKPVVAAFIQNEEGLILLARRPQGKKRGGLWEFPGGKVEEGETLEEALAREIEEELGVRPKVGKLLATVEHQYPEVAIRLFCFQAWLPQEPRPLEGQELGWFKKEEVEALPLAPADQKLWALLKSNLENS